MNLLALQRQFREWLASEDAAAAALFGDTASAGLSVYLNNYRSQLIATLTESYPVVRAWLGEGAFLGAAARHVDGVHSNGWTLDDYPRGFPATLALEYPSDPEVGELAELELSLGSAFAGPDGTATLAATSLENVDWARAVFVIAPTLMLVPVTTNAAAILSAIIGGLSPPAPDTLPQAGMVAVWRLGFTPRFRTLEPLEAEVLCMATQGHSFGNMCEIIAEQTGDREGPDVAGRFLGQWMRDEVVLAVRADRVSIAIPS